MSRTSLVIAADQADRTLAAIVREHAGPMPWSRARKIVSEGRVRVDDAVVRDPAVRVTAGARVEIDPTGAPPRTIAADDDAPVILLHVDAHVVVVDKPPGLSSVPWADERDSLQHRTHQLLRRQLGQRHLPPLRVVQRLDKDTSGVLVFARTRNAERSLASQLRAHTVQRSYVTLCEGQPVGKTHVSFLVADRGDGRRGSARGSTPPPGAKKAITIVEPLERFTVPGGVVSLVRCRLQTGRQHQIRIHLAEAGHPILGERVYGRRGRPVLVDASRPMLHAERLGFVHPAHERLVTFASEPPADFAALLGRLRPTPSS